MDKEPILSIIIPTLDRLSILKETIAQIQQQIFKEYEIIIIDQTEIKDQSFIAYCNDNAIIYLEGKIKNTALARNIGIQKAHGKILLFLDDDIKITSPYFLAKYIANFQTDKIGAIQGRILQLNDLPVESIKAVGYFNAREGIMESNFNAQERVQVHNLSTCNCAILTEVIDKIGQFNKLFNYNNYFEDTELAIRIEKLGYSIFFDPSCEIEHLQVPFGGNIHQTDSQLMFDFTYNYTILLICNFQFLYYLLFFQREISKRFINYVAKGMKKHKWDMFRCALFGTFYATKEVLHDWSYIKQRRRLS